MQIFHQKFELLAEMNQLDFVPFLMQGLSVGLEKYQADGMHPTAKAQATMMNNVWQTLQLQLKNP